MADYIYTRETVNGRYNMDNIFRVDGVGDMINLAQDIISEGTLPTDVNTSMSGGSCTISFSETLTAPQITTLDALVVTYKSYT